MLTAIILIGLVISGILILRLAHYLDRYFGNTPAREISDDQFSS